ncbi:MAG: glycosyltransferase family 87 protein, partial [Halobacteriota archaeon]
MIDQLRDDRLPPTTTPGQSVRRRTRLVLLVGLVAGIVTGVVTAISSADQVMLASDVYYYAGRALVAGDDIYSVTPPGRSGYHYLYPPIVAVVFLPHVLLGSEVAAFALQTLVNVGVALGTALVICRGLARRNVDISRVDRALIGAFVLVSAHAIVPLLNGQVTHWLALAFAIAFDALDRNQESIAGGLVAVAALVKLFPAAIGLWLVRIRAWRALVVSIGTGLG